TPRGVIAKFIGEAGMDQAPELERQMRILAQLPPGLLVLDLSELSSISSVGLGVLIRFRNEIEGKGGKIKLAALRPQVMDTFKFAKLDRIFEIHPTTDAALGG